MGIDKAQDRPGVFWHLARHVLNEKSRPAWTPQLLPHCGELLPDPRGSFRCRLPEKGSKSAVGDGIEGQNQCPLFALAATWRHIMFLGLSAATGLVLVVLVIYVAIAFNLIHD
jgi:hypothetical protein